MKHLFRHYMDFIMDLFVVLLFLCITEIGHSESNLLVGQESLQYSVGSSGNRRYILEVDTHRLPHSMKEEAVIRNLEVIQARLHAYGIADAIVERSGECRILVQIPSVKDNDDVFILISKTGYVAFKLVAEPDLAEEIIQRIDAAMEIHPELSPYTQQLLDESEASVSDNKHDPGVSQGILGRYLKPGQNTYWVRNNDIDIVSELISDMQFVSLVPQGYMVGLGPKNPDYGRSLFVLHNSALLTSSDINSAEVKYNVSTDTGCSTDPCLALRFSHAGTRKYERVTGDNLNRRLAIMMDCIVYSGYVIHECIVDGKINVIGNFTASQVRLMEILINSGHLYAPMIIVDYR